MTAKKNPTKLQPKKSEKKEVALVKEKPQIDESIISSIVLRGDISGLNDIQRTKYNIQLCQSLGLNPMTQPFQILKLNGKEVLYATKSATEQLRKIYGVSVTSLDRQILNDICIVTANVADATGRTDASTGAVNIGGIRGNELANAIMKAETKAKRRATLSICGLGMLDESEIETIPGKHNVTTITGDVISKQDSEDIPIMTIEAACDELRKAKDMRSLVSIATKIRDAAKWTSDDSVTLRDVYKEIESSFKVAADV